MSETIAGIDASLTGTGVAVLPEKWDGEIRDVETSCFGYGISHGTEKERIERCILIARDVVKMMRRLKVTSIFIENYSFGSANRAHHLGELGGVIRSQLYLNLKLVVQPVAPMSARKTFLGKVPKKKSKEIAQQGVDSLGKIFDYGDEKDALIIANHGSSLLGQYAVTLAEGGVR